MAATAHDAVLSVSLQRSACDWMQVPLIPLPVIAIGTGCAVPSELFCVDRDFADLRSHVACPFQDSRGEVMGVLCYSFVKELPVLI